ncbi:unnamed protein product [Discula destructiva]
MSMWKMFRPGHSETTPLLPDIGSDNPPGPAPPSSPTSSPPMSPAAGQDYLSGAIEARRGSASSPVWSDPLGRPARGDDDEHLRMFRRAVGINNHTQSGGVVVDNATVGIYSSVLRQERRKRIMHHTLSGMVWGCHGVQIVLGATLTCLGLSTDEYPVTVTVLGAVNTVTASFLALVKGKGITEKVGRTEADFRQLKVWIEETDALLALGVIGGDRKEVGLLIETAFRRYNACFGRSFDIEAGIDMDVDDISVMDAERSRIEDDAD